MDKAKQKFSALTRYQEWPYFLRLVGVLLIIAIPVLITMFVLTPIISRSGRHEERTGYVLRKGFSESDIQALVARMKQDTEFAFYFKMLSDKNITKGVSEVYRLLDPSRDKKDMRLKIQSLQDNIRPIALLQSSFDYSELGKGAQLDKESGLIKSLWLFLYEDFKLAVAGFCYKCLHDSDFRFSWDETTRQAARNVQMTIRSLPPSRQSDLKEAVNNF